MPSTQPWFIHLVSTDPDASLNLVAEMLTQKLVDQGIPAAYERMTRRGLEYTGRGYQPTYTQYIGNATHQALQKHLEQGASVVIIPHSPGVAANLGLPPYHTDEPIDRRREIHAMRPYHGPRARVYGLNDPQSEAADGFDASQAVIPSEVPEILPWTMDLVALSRLTQSLADDVLERMRAQETQDHLNESLACPSDPSSRRPRM